MIKKAKKFVSMEKFLADFFKKNLNTSYFTHKKLKLPPGQSECIEQFKRNSF